ncbi:hypothetical protein [Paenibacillus sp.]|uniref:hypothetical protein n=1 Tax=Paenibacillus sp. TaxID=58172 RepID=UPI002D27ACEC|nr:hypothetical protein [Paenibacillus sp.]HZG84795.1 hypothetical protein [Paenibacillus sp.]
MDRIPPALLRFFERDVPIYTHFAAGVPGAVPFACRGYGFRLKDPAQGPLCIAIMKSQMIRLQEHIETNPMVAALMTSGKDNESYQIKGRFLGFRAPEPEDRRGIERQIESTAQWVPSLVEIIQAQPRDCVVIEMSVDAVYVQSPGSGAGRPLAEGGA